jgi:hypothetical protein
MSVEKDALPLRLKTCDPFSQGRPSMSRFQLARSTEDKRTTPLTYVNTSLRVFRRGGPVIQVTRFGFTSHDLALQTISNVKGLSVVTSLYIARLI